MRQWTVNAFADRPFTGNAAAVVEPLRAWPDDGWMQALAAENKHSETAFLRATEDQDRFDLRWFTPTTEVPLCGHATQAAAHVLWTEIGADPAVLTFGTASGRLTVRRTGGGYEMDFPRDPLIRVEIPAGLAEALGAMPVEVWASRYLIAVMADAEVVRGLRPTHGAVLPFGEGCLETGQVVVAGLAGDDADHDVVDRFFGPGCGLEEDAATGSARGGLAPLFADTLGRATVRFVQAYPGRGARFETEVREDRVLIRGSALTVMESTLRIAP